MTQTNSKTFVAILVGEIKDNYMSIGHSEKEAKERIIEKYFKDTEHCENDLNEKEIYIDVLVFDETTTAIVY